MASLVLRNRYSFVAGACAAGGSFFGKLPSHLIAQRLVQHQPGDGASASLAYYSEFMLVRSLPIALMVVCNVLNWRYFMKALQTAEQTLLATVLTACSNYMISFVLGLLVYREPVSLLSAVGAALMVLGLWFLCGAQDEKARHEKLS